MHIKALWYKTNLHSLKAMQRLDRLLKNLIKVKQLNSDSRF